MLRGNYDSLLGPFHGGLGGLKTTEEAYFISTFYMYVTV